MNIICNMLVSDKIVYFEIINYQIKKHLDDIKASIILDIFYCVSHFIEIFVANYWKKTHKIIILQNFYYFQDYLNRFFF